MAEESLFSQIENTEESQVTDEQRQPAATERKYDFIRDKYLTGDRTEDDALIEQAKAYTELEKHLRGFTGAPEEYTLELPEEISDLVDVDSDAYKSFVEFAKANNMNNEMANEALKFHVEEMKQLAAQLVPQSDPAAEMKLLGNHAAKRIQAVERWGASNLPPEDMEAFQSMATSARQIEVLEKLMATSKNTPLATESEPVPVPIYSVAQFNRDVADPRYKTDPEFRKQALAKLERVQGRA